MKHYMLISCFIHLVYVASKELSKGNKKQKTAAPKTKADIAHDNEVAADRMVEENKFEDGEGQIVEARIGEKGPVYKYSKHFLDTIIKSFPEIRTTGCYFYIDDDYKVCTLSPENSARLYDYIAQDQDIPTLELQEPSSTPTSSLSESGVNNLHM